MTEQVNEWVVRFDEDDYSYRIIEQKNDGTENLIATVMYVESMYLFSASRGLLEACRFLNEAVEVFDDGKPKGSTAVVDFEKLRKARLIAGAAYNSATRSKQ